LASDAVSSYVERELEIVAGIEAGLIDARAGHVRSHDDAMAQLRATIAAAKSD
jgi:predicted transcriptional regulator